MVESLHRPCARFYGTNGPVRAATSSYSLLAQLGLRWQRSYHSQSQV